LPKLNDSGRKKRFSEQFDGVRRGFQPDLRPIILNWFCVYHPNEAREFFQRWSIEYSETLFAPKGEPVSPPKVTRASDPTAHREACDRILREETEQTGHLDLSFLPIAHVPEQISRLKKLKSLDLAGTKIESLASLVACPPIERLNLSHTRIRSLLASEACRSVTELTAMDTRLENLNGAESFPLLEKLYVWKGELFRSMEGIEENAALKELVCNNNPLMRDIYPLMRLRNLESLAISFTDVRSLGGLENSGLLTSLYCGGGALTSLNGIENCLNLRSFQSEWAHLQSLRPLLRCPNLETIKLSMVEVPDEESELWSRRNLKFLSCFKGKIGAISGDELVHDRHGNCLQSLRDRLRGQRRLH
jgi:hypothetical protein